MGKRSKAKSMHEEKELDTEQNIESQIEVSISKKKKSLKKQAAINESHVDDALIVKDSSKKRKKKKQVNLDTNQIKDEEPVAQGTKKLKKRKLASETPAIKTSKKKIFNDDGEEQEVPASDITSRTSKKNPVEDEDAVNDEDIDRFCDELDDEDNQQYKNWIKLLEKKLHPIKKK